LKKHLRKRRFKIYRKMGRARDLTNFQRGGIIAAKKLGHKNTEIAKTLGCSNSSVTRVLAAHGSGKVTKGRPGRERILNTPDRKALKEMILNNKDSRRQKLVQVTETVAKMKGKKVSKRTIQRALADENIHSCIPRRRPLISESNKKKRLEWCMERSDWTVEDWKKVLWSDESTFSQFQKSGWGRIWREPGEEFHEDCIASTVKHSPQRMFWGCFSFFGLGPLVPLVGSVTGEIHRETLANYAIPTVKAQARKQRKQFFFQEDNAPVHTAKVARDFLLSKHVQLLPWPAQSPDLNPIENIWAFVEAKLRSRRPQPSSIRALERVIAEEWESIPQEFYQDLVRSMPRRVEACIANNGGHTKY
jgi:transposase